MATRSNVPVATRSNVPVVTRSNVPVATWSNIPVAIYKEQRPRGYIQGATSPWLQWLVLCIFKSLSQRDGLVACLPLVVQIGVHMVGYLGPVLSQVLSDIELQQKDI